MATDIFDLEDARAEITQLVAKVWRHYVGKSLRGRAITLKVKYADLQIMTRSRTVGTAFSTSAEFETVARNLLDPFFPTAKGIRLIGVTISAFEEHGCWGQRRNSGFLPMGTDRRLGVRPSRVTAVTLERESMEEIRLVRDHLLNPKP